MNRTIKFRAWDEWQRYMAYQGTPDLETVQSFMHHFGDKVLLQFTEFHDKLGKEIYEGDIVRTWLEDSVEEDGGFWCKAVVEFYKGAWCFKEVGFDYEKKNEMPSLLFGHNELEIIGNIYENFNLLTQ